MSQNINEARREANSYTRAQEILKAGYTFTDMGDAGIAVCKPGELAAAYWISDQVSGRDGCSCPDFQKHGKFCKHTMAWDILKEEEAMMEALCAEHDAREAIEG